MDRDRRKKAVLLTLVSWGCLLALPAVAAEPECPEIVIGAGHPDVEPLPLPCSMPRAEYEKLLYTWVNDREYTKLGWQKDKEVRDTGPFVLGSNYGTHPAVRIYYSPEVYDWLKRDREGTLPPGSMIIKEMFTPPAARFEDQRRLYASEAEWEAMVQASVNSWTIMIRDDQTLDGWFWSSPTLVSRVGKTAEEYAAAIAATVDTFEYPFTFPASEHGEPSCLRCHATSEGESTFVDLDNIEGDGLRFRVDNSWRTNLDNATLTDVGGQLVYLENRLDELAPEQRPAAGQDEETLFLNAFHGNSSAATVTEDGEELASQPLAEPDPEFTRYFQLGGSGGAVEPSTVRAFPGQWADHVPAGPGGAEQFITSDNCLGCHGGLGGAPYGVTMFLQTGPSYGDGYNISPFGEWRWSPMGLAGRDPIFYSQLATELALLDRDFEQDPEAFDDDPVQLEDIKSALVETCLSCHGGMGQRQLLIDHADGNTTLDPTFRREFVYAHTALTREQEQQPNYAYHKYGNLAREGISCTLCHHIDPPTEWRPGMDEQRKEELFLVHSTTGQFPYSPPDELSGPFDDVIELPMEQSLGITPVYNAYVKDSRMCGTCHTINLPNVDCPKGGDPANPARCKPYPVLDESARLQARALEDRYGVDYARLLADNFPHSIEQATYLEWKNSDFAEPGSEDYQSCQDCHMPRSFESLDGSIDIPQLASQIASIQDSTYPEAAHDLPAEERFVPVRSDYRRHELVGLNVFLLEMFDQFDPILGVDETDYMTSATTGDKLAVENMLLQGRQKTLTVDIDIVEAEGRDLVADVTLESLVGHRFPSGVGFRRAWIELVVLDASQGGELVWASGRTNSVGLIIDGEGEPLPTEFFEDEKWQPHYHGIPPEGCRACRDSEGNEGCRAGRQCQAVPPPITRQDQVQIYEEVTLNGEDEVTYSFVHRDEHPKDNRFLPRGWKPADRFAGEILPQFMAATEPEGVAGDPDYTEGNTGQDSVRYRITLPEGHDAANATVRATVYSQSIQPYWMKRKFELSGDDPATRRLYYITSHLRTSGTVIDDWKLALVSCSRSVAGQVSGGCAGD